MLPIACGLAYAGERVWCFVGDMCASIGALKDAMKFCHGHRLQCYFIVEDNGLSTNTPTDAAWAYGVDGDFNKGAYGYVRTYPHYQPLPDQRGF